MDWEKTKKENWNCTKSGIDPEPILGLEELIALSL